MLTWRQEYEIKNGGFGRGKYKGTSVGAVEARVSDDEKTFRNTQEVVNGVEKWVKKLASLCLRIETQIGARLTEDPKNEALQRLKHRYMEVLDALPKWPDEGLDSFEEGQMMKAKALRIA